MANKDYSGRKADEKYEGEQGMSGMGQMAKTGEAKSRDNTGSFQPREKVNNMQGTGARTPDQAEYVTPKDNWRGK
jgi:hypothetical protein